MIPLATILSLLGTPAGQVVVGFAGQELGRGAGSLHTAIQIDLYNRMSAAIIYRAQAELYQGQVRAYVRTINHQSKGTLCHSGQISARTFRNSKTR